MIALQHFYSITEQELVIAIQYWDLQKNHYADFA